MKNSVINYVTENTPMPARYLRIDKGLLECAVDLKLDLMAVYLYSLLRNRAGLSAQHGWYDDNGNIYVVFTRGEFMRETGCSKKTAIDAFKKLRNAGLIVEEARANPHGCTLAPHIYVKQWNRPSLTLTIEDIKDGALPYLTLHNVNSIADTYIELPQNLLKDLKLTIRARLLYALVWDTTRLSLEYGRADRKGRFWCAVDACEAKGVLNCSASTLSKTYAELVAAGLISRVHAEYCGIMHTYLHPCWVENSVMPAVAEEKIRENIFASDSYPSEVNDEPQNNKIVCYRNSKNEPQLDEISTQENLTRKTAPSDLQSRSIVAFAPDVAAIGKKYFEQISDFNEDILINDPAIKVSMAVYIPEIRSMALSVMTSDAVSKERKIKVSNDLVEKTELLEAYEKIDKDIFAIVLSKILPGWRNVEKKIPYLRAVLFNAYDQHHEEAAFFRSRAENSQLF